MGHYSGYDCISQCNLDPWNSDASSIGSCLSSQEDFEAVEDEITNDAPPRMAFPARMADRPIIEGHFQDRNKQSQVHNVFTPRMSSQIPCVNPHIASGSNPPAMQAANNVDYPPHNGNVPDAAPWTEQRRVSSSLLQRQSHSGSDCRTPNVLIHPRLLLVGDQL
ncbi:hypothetical protein M758_UG306000 [Ceratodon purpureus]|nr:hypothetical protein M758_UG306000 [Ceratodon purpureus]